MIPTNTFKIALDRKMKLLPSARLLDKVVSKLGLSAFGENYETMLYKNK